MEWVRQFEYLCLFELFKSCFVSELCHPNLKAFHSKFYWHSQIQRLAYVLTIRYLNSKQSQQNYFRFKFSICIFSFFWLCICLSISVFFFVVFNFLLQGSNFIFYALEDFVWCRSAGRTRSFFYYLNLVTVKFCFYST